MGEQQGRIGNAAESHGILRVTCHAGASAGSAFFPKWRAGRQNLPLVGPSLSSRSRTVVKMAAGAGFRVLWAAIWLWCDLAVAWRPAVVGCSGDFGWYLSAVRSLSRTAARYARCRCRSWGYLSAVRFRGCIAGGCDWILARLGVISCHRAIVRSHGSRIPLCEW